MEYNLSNLITDVKKEATALKANATSQELGRLNLSSLDSDNQINCIYGQMTGLCRNARASELIWKCCPRYFRNRHDVDIRKDVQKILPLMVKETIRGIEHLDAFMEDRLHLYHLSAIETYILLPNANKKHLIDFLKGEVDDINDL
jgi:hypothetical protein